MTMSSESQVHLRTRPLDRAGPADHHPSSRSPASAAAAGLRQRTVPKSRRRPQQQMVRFKLVAAQPHCRRAAGGNP